MKKTKGAKIRKVWAIKPISRIKTDTKRSLLDKIRQREAKNKNNRSQDL